MKRIFHFVKSNNLSGLENVVINICTLVKGYNYTYVSTKGPIERYLKKYGIKHITIPKLTPWNIFKVIRRYNPDIVQAHDARASVFLAFSYFYCKKYHIKMISELHNDDPKMHKWWTLRSILYAISSYVYDDIVVVSKRILKNYFYNNLIDDKTYNITNIVNPYRIYKQLCPEPITKKWDCIFVGRMAHQKNPLRFIKIIYELKKRKKDIKAILLGEGKLLKLSMRLTKKYDLGGNVKFLGFQSNPYKYMQRSKILVMTSRYEGLPMTILEALVIGIPIISTPLNGLKSILNKSYWGFAYNNKMFVNKIVRLLTNNNKYKDCCKNSLLISKRVNNIVKFINGYNKIYK